jgi:hypothetical protein
MAVTRSLANPFLRIRFRDPGGQIILFLSGDQVTREVSSYQIEETGLVQSLAQLGDMRYWVVVHFTKNRSASRSPGRAQCRQNKHFISEIFAGL